MQSIKKEKRLVSSKLSIQSSVSFRGACGVVRLKRKSLFLNLRAELLAFIQMLSC